MRQSDGDRRLAGGTMIAAAVGVVAAMGHHPSGAHGGALAGLVHGSMIGLLMLLAWGFVLFSAGRGAGKPLVAGALIAYAVSLVAHVGAATINGFVVPALADAAKAPIGHDIFRFAWQSNQALAALGVYTTGAAYMLWSADLIRDRGSAARLTGLAGFAAGAIPAALLFAGVIRLNVGGAFFIYGLHVGWAALVGAMMWAGRLQPSGNCATSS